MQIRSAKELIVYQKAYRLAVADDRDQKTEGSVKSPGRFLISDRWSLISGLNARQHDQVPQPLPDLRPLISALWPLWSQFV